MTFDSFSVYDWGEKLFIFHDTLISVRSQWENYTCKKE